MVCMQLCEYTKNYWILQIELRGLILSESHLNKFIKVKVEITCLGEKIGKTFLKQVVKVNIFNKESKWHPVNSGKLIYKGHNITYTISLSKYKNLNLIIRKATLKEILKNISPILLKDINVIKEKGLSWDYSWLKEIKLIILNIFHSHRIDERGSKSIKDFGITGKIEIKMSDNN